MVMNIANTKGLGERQWNLINKLYADKTLFVRVVQDDYELRVECELADEDNTYEDINPILFNSLVERKILVIEKSMHKSLNITIEQYMLSPFLIFEI